MIAFPAGAKVWIAGGATDSFPVAQMALRSTGSHPSFELPIV